MIEQAIIQTVELKAAELKFLMKLWNCEGYRSDISHLSPTPKTPVSKRDLPAEGRCHHICQSLAEKGLVDYDTEIFRFALSAPGRMLLSLQTTSLPVTPDELKLLRGCKGSMTLKKLGSRVPPGSGQQLVSSLVSRKLLKVTKSQITEVRLTKQGQQFLHNTGHRNSAARKMADPVVLSAKL